MNIIFQATPEGTRYLADNDPVTWTTDPNKAFCVKDREGRAILKTLAKEGYKDLHWDDMDHFFGGM